MMRIRPFSLNIEGNYIYKEYAMNICKVIFYLNAFIIFWAMIGYQISIKILSRIYKRLTIKRDYSLKPSVTVMVAAHNEDKVILAKMNNLIELDYPKDKLKILVASDNSMDRTNEFVELFITEHKDFDIKLYKVKERRGKTNAQNEAQKLVDTDYLVMTDANSMLKKDSVKELMAVFISEDIKYVTGRLIYINKETSGTSDLESGYWTNDLSIRNVEARMQTITAGNGALYACRNKDYFDINPMRCHDSEMPLQYGLMSDRAICNDDAVAYEKAGEVIHEEFKRKIRMNRDILRCILPDIRLLNIFKYRWFSYFYFGHRTCRYLLWLSHLLVFISNLFLIKQSFFYLIIFAGQVLFYVLTLLEKVSNLNNKLMRMIYYYSITIMAQWVGVYNILTGKTQPFWEKAESTR